MKARLNFLSCLLVFAGLTPGAGAAPKALYFSSPQQAVTRATELLRAKNWPELARYYDLAGTGFALADLRRGTFFLRANPPADAHPGGMGNYREPFAPGYEFIGMARAEEPGVYAVTVGVVTDKESAPVQGGRKVFYLRQTATGFQLLPAAPRERDVSDPAHASTGGISGAEAAWRAGVDNGRGDWHAHYAAPLATWFFASSQGQAVALQRVAVPASSPLAEEAAPESGPRPWRWIRRALPAADLIAVAELGNGPAGATRFESLPGDFWEFVLPGEPGQAELAVPREALWPLLDRAREFGWKLKVATVPPAGAALTLVRP